MRTFSSDKTCLSGELAALGAVRTTVFSDGSTPVGSGFRLEAIVETIKSFRVVFLLRRGHPGFAGGMPYLR